MKQITSIVSLTMLSSSLLLSGAVHSYQAGDVIVRAGSATISPTSSYSSVAGGAFNLRADDDTQLGVSVSYMFHDAWSINLLAATPYKHDIEAKEAGGSSIASARHLPPTVTVSWYPLAHQGSAFKPYVGAGLNYTFFWDETLNATGKAATGAEKLSLSSSWGLAAQLGFDYSLNDHWGVGAAVYYVDLDTDVKLDGNKIGSVDIDPLVYRLQLAYRF